MFKTAEEYADDIEVLFNDFRETWGVKAPGGYERTAWDDAYEKLIEEEIPDVLPQEFWDRLTPDQKLNFIDVSTYLFGSYPDHALGYLKLMIEDVLDYGDDFPLIYAIADHIWPYDCEQWYGEVSSMLTYIRSIGYTITKENK